MKLSFAGDRRLAALVRFETVEGGTLLTVRPAVRPCTVTLLQTGSPDPLVVRLQGADRLGEVVLSCTSERERELLDSTTALGWQLEDGAQWLFRGERPAPAGLLFAHDDLAAPRLEVLASDRGGEALMVEVAMKHGRPRLARRSASEGSVAGTTLKLAIMAPLGSRDPA